MANSRVAILLYSDDSTVRASVRSALGTKLSPGHADNEIFEFATAAALHAFIDARPSGQVADLIILDAEAVPEGGMGIARALKDEVFQCPPVLLLVARADDAWLAAWSRAEAVVMHPIDPFTFAQSAAALLADHADRSRTHLV
jgi:DNA-binding response OmpR family regulator